MLPWSVVLCGAPANWIDAPPGGGRTPSGEGRAPVKGDGGEAPCPWPSCTSSATGTTIGPNAIVPFGSKGPVDSRAFVARDVRAARRAVIGDHHPIEHDGRVLRAHGRMVDDQRSARGFAADDEMRARSRERAAAHDHRDDAGWARGRRLPQREDRAKVEWRGLGRRHGDAVRRARRGARADECELSGLMNDAGVMRRDAGPLNDHVVVRRAPESDLLLSKAGVIGRRA